MSGEEPLWQHSAKRTHSGLCPRRGACVGFPHPAARTTKLSSGPGKARALPQGADGEEQRGASADSAPRGLLPDRGNGFQRREAAVGRPRGPGRRRRPWPACAGAVPGVVARSWAQLRRAAGKPLSSACPTLPPRPQGKRPRRGREG